ncbi:hypothetical protein NQ318_003199 [Aromia moschata]|uniref:Headcase N-terminal domain-containing protein n=1 Tax=Aromia moschata TaxID=1265417 RepID=A0AAV8YFJ9_9CUCU|nr:hypothetical protein NQ318_003199 [Aromia moschata]
MKEVNRAISAAVRVRKGAGRLPRGRRPWHRAATSAKFKASLGIDPLDDASSAGVTRCCVPSGECLRAQQHQLSPNNNDPMVISLDDLRDTVRVTCNNELCTSGRYMHRECFDQWEQTVLAYLKTCGRARSWSERQRHQNLWTKKGYDLAYKACGCRCGRGHLKKDLDWMPPPPTSNIFGRIEEIDSAGKKKKRRNRNGRPSLSISAGHPIGGGPVGAEVRARTGSLSCSSTGSSSPPTSGSEPSISPVHAHSKKKTKVELPERIRNNNVNVVLSHILGLLIIEEDHKKCDARSHIIIKYNKKKLLEIPKIHTSYSVTGKQSDNAVFVYLLKGKYINISTRIHDVQLALGH